MNTPTPVPPPAPAGSNFFVTLWQNHGTKILGGLTALTAVVAVMTPAQFAVYGIDGHTALRIIAGASGLLTVLRGFTNSAASK